MSFCKWIIAAFAGGALTVGVAADDGYTDVLLERTRNALQSQDELIDKDFAEVLRRTPGTSEEFDWVRSPTRGPEQERTEPVASDTAQGRAWQDIEAETFARDEARSEGPPHPPVPEDVLYVYISLSMPAATIRSLFLEALDLKESLNTVFVLRGWNVPGPNQLVARLNTLFPDAEKLGELPNVQINPVLYQQQHIELVPTYSKQASGGRWEQVLGVTSLEDAVRRIEEARYEGQVIGPTYGIEEPDILKLIEQRAAGIDWEAEVERVRDGLMTRTTTGRSLPYATRNDSYLVDLTIVNNQDLAGNRGEVFAYAGETINPLDYLTLTRKYVFIDANRPEHVQQAVEWRKEHAPITVITTLPMATIEERKRVGRALGQPVYEINDLLVRRFQLREVPAIAFQDGRMLRVDIVAPQTRGLAMEAANERR